LYDAKEEVYLPMLELCTLCLPQESDDGYGNLIPPGPTILDALDVLNEAYKDSSSEQAAYTKIYDVGAQMYQSLKEKGIRSSAETSLSIGTYFRLKKIVVEKAEPTFSIEVDERGYPIAGKISLDIKSVYIATTGMIDSSIGKAQRMEWTNKTDVEKANNFGSRFTGEFV
jgi:hypothetical protein